MALQTLVFAALFFPEGSYGRDQKGPFGGLHGSLKEKIRSLPI